MTTVGVVLIGRNEGLRLQASIASVLQEAERSDLHLEVVYMDSGSTDDSVAFARSKGLTVVELDMSIPFTAGRARNEGFAALEASGQTPDYVQFIDGDCQLEPGWLNLAVAYLEENESVAVVCGRLQEAHPELSIYNYFCQLEWDGPIGEIRSSGGIFLIRSAAFRGVGGFNTNIIAGEEPDLCFRVRRNKGLVWRLGSTMAHHDAAISRLGQWIKRSVRTGHAYAQVYDLHKSHPEQLFRRELVSAAMWGAILPIFTVLISFWSPQVLVLISILYLNQIYKITKNTRKTQAINVMVYLHAVNLIFIKTAYFWGAMKYVSRKIRKTPVSIIEYK